MGLQQPLVRRHRMASIVGPPSQDCIQAVIRIGGSDTHQLHQGHVPALMSLSELRNQCTLAFVDTTGRMNAYRACVHAPPQPSASARSRIVQIRDEPGQLPSLTGAAQAGDGATAYWCHRIRFPLIWRVPRAQVAWALPW